METVIEVWERVNAFIAPVTTYVSNIQNAPVVVLTLAVIGFVSKFLADRQKRRSERQLARAVAYLPSVRLDRGYSPLSAEQVLRLPTSLVIANHGVVPFDDSRGLLGEPGEERTETLLGWATTGQRVLGRLYAAAGGYGKTRLALEAVKRLSKQGWNAGFLDREALDEALAKPASGGRSALADALESKQGKGLLIVIDYAETRIEQMNALAATLAKAPSGGPRVRVLMLARTDQWWASFLERLVPEQALLFEKEAHKSAATDLALERRQAFFDAACAAFSERLAEADKLQRTGETPLLDPDWRKTPPPAEALTWDGSPVNLAFQAFLHVRGNTLTRSPLAEMAKEERRHHARALGQAGLGDAKAEAMTGATALLTLAQGISPAHEKENVLTTLVRVAASASPGFSGDDSDLARDEIRTAIRSLYGRGDATRPILPDILGECMVGEVLARAPKLLDQLMDVAPFAELPALVVCNRATRSVHGAQTRAAFQAALEVALPSRLESIAQPLVTAALADLGEIQTIAADALRELPRRAAAGKAIVKAAAKLIDVNAVPSRLRSFLGEAALASDAKDPIVRSDPGQETMADAAAEADARATFLGSVGKRAEALAAGEQAASLYRTLFAADANAYRARLAACLNNLGNRRAEMAQRWEALEASAQSVALYRELASEGTGGFLHDLSLALIAMSDHLFDLDRREDALDAAEEAVGRIRGLAAKDQPTFAASLALAVSNVGLRLRQLGRQGEALAASAEATRINSQLASLDRDAFTPRLADALLTQSGDLAMVGRNEEALNAVQEAMSFYRELVDTHADAFLPGLAISMTAAANRLAALGRAEEARAASEEALGCYRELVEQNREVFAPRLAQALVARFQAENSAGATEDALAAIKEAVELCRELVAANPESFEPDLAMSLHNLGIAHARNVQPDEALTAATEAVALYRRLAEKRAVFAPGLATALGNLANRLNALGRRDEALTQLGEVVSIERQLASTAPEQFLPSLARALDVLAAQFAALGQHEDAQNVSTQSVTIYRDLAAQNANTFAGELAASLTSCGAHLSRSGRCAEACAASAEAVTLYRDLVASNQASPFALAMSACSRGDVLLACDQAKASADSYEAGIKDLLKLADAPKDVLAPRIAFNASSLAKALQAAGQDEAGIRERLTSLGLKADEALAAMRL